MSLLEMGWGWIRSILHAFRGIGFVAQAQQNFLWMLIAAVIVLSAGLMLALTRIEMALLVLIVALILAAELINSAVEYTLNILEAHHHPAARTAKDAAAGAVLILVFASVAMGIFVFGPRVVAILKGVPVP